MRVFRFTVFVGTMTGLLSTAVYLWTPLIVPNLPNARLAQPEVALSSVHSIEANPGLFRPPVPPKPLRPSPIELPYGKQSRLFDGEPTLAIVPLARPKVSLAPKPAPGPGAVVGVSISTGSSGARMEHPASATPVPALATPPASPQPPRSSSPSSPKPVLVGKPRPTPQPLPQAVPPQPQLPAPQPDVNGLVPAPAQPPTDVQVSTVPAVSTPPPAVTPPPVVTPPVVTPPPATQLMMGPQAMEGDLKLTPSTNGVVLTVGYDFTMPGNHADVSVQFLTAYVSFVYTCLSSSGQTLTSTGTITVPIADASYDDPVNSSAWYPSGVQSDASVYQGQYTVQQSLCGAGNTVRLQEGGTFFAGISPSGPGKINVRWHYSANDSAGGWSGTATAIGG
jgi:hypothetical protein